jgi:hypothetical protein
MKDKLGELNPCIGCEYFMSPYWSIESPCKRCPHITGEDSGYITTNTCTISNLPTSEDYAASALDIAFQSTRQWSEPKYRCPKCGGGMCRNEMIVLTSYPAQYTYRCDKCGHVEYQYM